MQSDINSQISLVRISQIQPDDWITWYCFGFLKSTVEQK